MESLIHENPFRDTKFGPKNIPKVVHKGRLTIGHKQVGSLSAPLFGTYGGLMCLKVNLSGDFNIRRLHILRKTLNFWLKKGGSDFPRLESPRGFPRVEQASTGAQSVLPAGSPGVSELLPPLHSGTGRRGHLIPKGSGPSNAEA